ncbi:hypothetical protein ABW20_dc0106520 [Dactylellina cionopaga]|nr:hypothetical protein ABW20_dc0106520 [Dactylellina cionopaga]
MIAHIATSADTPAPIRPHRILPNPTWSKEELEEDPFKPRPKVALSPPLTPYRLQSNGAELSGTPQVGISSTINSDDDYDDYDDDDGGNASPSKGRGTSYR